jgi:hypothetical protein
MVAHANATLHTLAYLRRDYLDDKHDPDMQLMLVDYVDRIRDQLNKIDAFLMTVQSEADNTWYECINCGQKTFGRVDVCDFCQETNFKRIPNR